MKKILIVEDDEMLRTIVNDHLTEAGFECVAVQDAMQAMSFVQSDKPDLIILDIMLPGGDGLEVLKNVRLSSKTNNIPVIIMTGKEDEETRSKAIKEGVQAYLQKPVSPEKLLESVNKVLGKNKDE